MVVSMEHTRRSHIEGLPHVLEETIRDSFRAGPTLTQTHVGSMHAHLEFVLAPPAALTDARAAAGGASLPS